MTPAQQQKVSSWVYGMVTPGGTWKLCYQKSRDGQYGSTFHSKCDKYTKTITVMKTSGNKVIGGTNVGSWGDRGQNPSTSGEIARSPYQMLFSLTLNQTMNRSSSSYYPTSTTCSYSYGPHVRSRHARIPPQCERAQ